MSQSHRVEGETTDKLYQDQCFQWDKGVSIDVCDPFNFPYLLHTQIYNTDTKTDTQSPLVSKSEKLNNIDRYSLQLRHTNLGSIH